MGTCRGTGRYSPFGRQTYGLAAPPSTFGYTPTRAIRATPFRSRCPPAPSVPLSARGPPVAVPLSARCLIRSPLRCPPTVSRVSACCPLRVLLSPVVRSLSVRSHAVASTWSAPLSAALSCCPPLSWSVISSSSPSIDRPPAAPLRTHFRYHHVQPPHPRNPRARRLRRRVSGVHTTPPARLQPLTHLAPHHRPHAATTPLRRRVASTRTSAGKSTPSHRSHRHSHHIRGLAAPSLDVARIKPQFGVLSASCAPDRVSRTSHSAWSQRVRSRLTGSAAAFERARIAEEQPRLTGSAPAGAKRPFR